MKVAIIVAAAENHVIGKDNDLIWNLPKDMKFFKDTTKGHFVIMGRKNFESIPHKYRPLPNRTNVVVTRQESYPAEGCIVVNSISDALIIAKEANDEEPFIIGGGEIYRLALEQDLVDIIYLTRIHKNYEGDTFFPELSKIWKLIRTEKHEADEKHECAYSFEVYEKA